MTRPPEDPSPEVERVVDAISDGAEVAWDAEAAGGTADPETLAALRLIDGVARLHRSGGSPGAHERRTADEEPEGPAPGPASGHVWGRLLNRGPLGQGSYGQVFRAFDPGLQREEALKLWAFPVRPRLIEQLLDEARALARIRHPNVLLVHGADVHDGRVGMWTELLDGETLEQLIAQHGGCDFREAAVYGIQLCRALSAVHAIGLVHLDVKAANVMRERGGRIVLMDFGSAGRPSDTAVEAGVQGTPLAMAPEVLEGAAATPAADVFSLGVLIFRLVAAQYPVTAHSLEDLRGRLARGPLPSLRASCPQVPLAFAAVIDRALERDPSARIGTAAEFERLLAEALSSDWTGAALPARPDRRPARGRWIPWAAAAVVVVALLLGLGWPHRAVDGATGQPMQFTLQLPPGERIPQFANVVVSPDGSRIVFASADSSGNTALWVRPFDALSSTRLPGTEGATYPFWSPDSREVAFFAAGRLKRVGMNGSAVRVICEAQVGRGGSWSRAGTILFSSSIRGPILRVPAAGGTPTTATTLDSTRAEVSHRWPFFLPDGDHFLYLTTPARDGAYALYVGSLRSDRRVYVGPIESGAVYTQGLLVYLFNQGLEARPFDVRKLCWAGEPLPIASISGAGGSLAEPQASVSENGTLVHTIIASRENQLAWLDARTGATTPLAVGPFFDPAVSPDGRRVVVEHVEGPGRSSLWMIDAASGAAERWTAAPGLNRAPQWSPDGDSIVFSTNRKGSYEFYVRATDGSLQETPLYSPSRALYMWSDDWRPGGLMTYARYETGTDYNIYELRSGVPVAIARTPATETHSALSPDSKWLAFESNASGSRRIQVVDRDTQSRYVLPGEGGMQPRWSRGTGRLYYRTPSNVFHEVTPVPGRRPTEWSTRELLRTGEVVGFDVDPRGERLLCCLRTIATRPEEIAVLLNLKQAAENGL